jgi:hypothetical protein
MNFKLNKARAKVAAARAAIAKDNEAQRVHQAAIIAAQARVAAMKEQRAAKGLDVALADAMDALDLAEEEALVELNIHLAGAIVKRQATDPIKHHAWIIANVAKLRASMRSAFDTPNNEKYSQHPLVTQALALIPPLDDMDRPVYELGSPVELLGLTDWRSRRKAILAAADTEPPQAA